MDVWAPKMLCLILDRILNRGYFEHIRSLP